MPLSARVRGKTVIAPFCDDATWEELRDIARTERDNVVLSSTGKQCFPRTSNLGLKHFVARAGNSAGPSEPALHEVIKAVVAKALLGMGLKVDAEYPVSDTHYADVVSSSAVGPIAWEVELDNMKDEYYSMVSAANSAAGFTTVFVTPYAHRLPMWARGISVDVDKRAPIESIEDVRDNEIAALAYRKFRNVPCETLEDVVRLVAGGATITVAGREAATVHEKPCDGCGEMLSLWRHDACVFPSGHEALFNALMAGPIDGEFCPEWMFDALEKVYRDGEIAAPGLPIGEDVLVGCRHCGLVAGFDDSIPAGSEYSFVLTPREAPGTQWWAVQPNNTSVVILDEEIHFGFGGRRQKNGKVVVRSDAPLE